MEDVLVLNLPAEVAILESGPGVDSEHFLLALPGLAALFHRERDNFGNWCGVAHLGVSSDNAGGLVWF